MKPSIHCTSAARTRQVMLVLGVVVLVGSLPMLALSVQAAPAPIYASPRPGAALVSRGTTIALRWGPALDAADLRNDLFQVEGAQSGHHTGQVVLSDDQSTLIFRPYLPFAPGEKVTVGLGAGLRSAAGQSLGAVSFDFHISPQVSPQRRLPASTLFPEETHTAPADAQEPSTNQIVSNFLTLPGDFPYYTITVPANSAGEGYVFLAPSFGPPSLRPYLLILDNSGQPIYYKATVAGAYYLDFKRQPNGWLTYYDTSEGYFTVLDSSYNMVDTYKVGHGYFTDGHDLQILPNGHALLLGNDDQTMDLSQIINGGSPTATVSGLIVQELDTEHNVVFEWRSWDHFNITDSVRPVTGTLVDYVHANAIELDQNDNNLLLSSRHMNEITKINHQTGDIVWRLGGKNNQFTPTNFLNTEWFAYQHDIRRLANGNLTLWDNRNNLQPAYSRAGEYQVDETHRAVTQVWQFRNTPDTYSSFMGNTQRLSNGNTVMGWGGSSAPAVTEVKSDNSKAFELSLQATRFSYRAFRFLWQGFPTTDPTLVVTTTGVTTTLAYSWNGASEIASYRVYGGDSIYPNTLLKVQPRTGFEDHTELVGLQGLYCYFRVMPIDKRGFETRYSNEVHLTPLCQPQKTYLPYLAQ